MLLSHLSLRAATPGTLAETVGVNSGTRSFGIPITMREVTKHIQTPTAMKAQKCN